MAQDGETRNLFGTSKMPAGREAASREAGFTEAAFIPALPPLTLGKQTIRNPSLGFVKEWL